MRLTDLREHIVSTTGLLTQSFSPVLDLQDLGGLLLFLWTSKSATLSSQVREVQCAFSVKGGLDSLDFAIVPGVGVFLR